MLSCKIVTWTYSKSYPKRNKDNILSELDCYIENLSRYRDAVAAEDMNALIALLDEGRRRKEEVDG